MSELTLIEIGKYWIETLPSGVISTWLGLERMFLYRLYSINKYKDKMVNISDFEQRETKSLHDV